MTAHAPVLLGNPPYALEAASAMACSFSPEAQRFNAGPPLPLNRTLAELPTGPTPPVGSS